MTDESDDSRTLAELRRAFTAPGAAPAPATCPPSASIWAAAAGELPPAELRAVIDHLAGCPSCVEDWRLATAVGLDTVADQPMTAPEMRRRSRRARFAVWGASAAAAAALIVEMMLGGPASVPRGGGHSAVSAAAPALDRENAIVSWQETPGATYDVVVTTATGDVVAEWHRLTVLKASILPDELAIYPPQTKLHLLVTATSSDGHRTAYSVRNLTLH